MCLCRASVRRLHVRHSDGLVPWRAFHYNDTSMRLRTSADARRDQRSRLQPITDHFSQITWKPGLTVEAAEWDDPSVLAETSVWAWVWAWKLVLGLV